MEIKPGIFVVLSAIGIDAGSLAARVSSDLSVSVGRTDLLCEFVCPAQPSSIRGYLDILRKEYPQLIVGGQYHSALHS